MRPWCWPLHEKFVHFDMEKKKNRLKFKLSVTYFKRFEVDDYFGVIVMRTCGM